MAFEVKVVQDCHKQRDINNPISQANRRAFPQVDLYIPVKPKAEQLLEAKVVLVFTHGGAWITGNKSDYQFLGLEMASRGVLTCVLGYRLAEKVPVEDGSSSSLPKNCFPAPYLDVAAGIEWVYRNISSFLQEEEKSRPVSLVLCGHSAGTHLNGLVILKDIKGEKYGLSREAKESVCSLVCVEGIYDLTSLATSFPTYSEWFLNTAFPPPSTTITGGGSNHSSSSSSSSCGETLHPVPPWCPDLSLCTSKDLDVTVLHDLTILCIYSKSDELVDERQAKDFIEFINNYSDHGVSVEYDDNSIVESSHDDVLKNHSFFDILLMLQ